MGVARTGTRLSDYARTRSVTVFLPRNKCLLISWLRSLFAVILERAGSVASLSPMYTAADTSPPIFKLTVLFFSLTLGVSPVSVISVVSQGLVRACA